MTTLQRIANLLMAFCFFTALVAVIGVCILALFQPTLDLTAHEKIIAVRAGAVWLLCLVSAFICLCVSR